MTKEEYIASFGLPEHTALHIIQLLFDDTDTLSEDDFQELWQTIEEKGSFASELAVVQREGESCRIAGYIPAYGAESIDQYHLPLARFREIVEGFRSCEAFDHVPT